MPKGVIKNLLSIPLIRKLLICFYAFLLLVTTYHMCYARKIIPGVKVGSVYVGGMTFPEARAALEEYESKQSEKLVLQLGDSKYEITADDIDLVYDWEGSVIRAFEVGRTGKLLQDSKDKVVGLFKKLYIGAHYDYSDDLLSLAFSLIDGDVNVPVGEAGFVFADDGSLEIISPARGKKVDSQALYEYFTEAFDRVQFKTMVLPVVDIEPIFSEADISPLKEEVRGLVASPVVVVYEDRKWQLGPEQLLDFIGFVRKLDGSVSLKLDSVPFESFLDTLAKDVNKLPRGKVSEVDGDKVVKFEVTEPGIELDKKAFTEEFKNAFFEGGSEVAVVIKEVTDVNGKDKYGIVSLLGVGTSKFTGSSQGRINNLTLAASRTDGVLVPPGEVYSLNSAVGEISSATGYDTAYIIQQGRTVLGAGGGVCQTSTTMFRAALNSGLPIVMRYPHDYRVYYYEIDGEPGMDATIFQPSIDFRFLNDTPGYLLIQTSYDLEENSLAFSIYGTPDGREVELSEVTVSGSTPPPEPLYQDDPTLAKGIVRQVDFAAWGATASFSRTVKKDGEVYIEDSYTTRYQPWRAIYLVGTKE